MAFLKSLFGPSKQEIWRQVAAEIGGELVEGGLLGSDKLMLRHGEWTLWMDVYTQSSGNSSTTYTRMQAPYLNAEGFRFRIYRGSIFGVVRKLFGVQDIEVGDPVFDDEFVIQGNDEERVKELLKSQNIKALIRMQPRFRLEVSDDDGFFGNDYGPAVDRLLFVVGGVIKQPHLLKGLFELYTELLDEVCARGSAYQDRNPLPETPLPPGTSASLQEMYAVIDHATRELYGRAERVGDAIEARVVLERPVELRARLVVTEPRLPADVCTISFDAQLADEVDLSPLEERLKEQTRRRRKLVAQTSEGFEVTIKEVPRVDVGQVLPVLIDGWRAAARVDG